MITVIMETLTDIVSDQLNIAADEVHPCALLVDDLGADSLDMIELLVAVEEAYALCILSEDAEELTTVRRATEYIMKQIGDRACTKI